jgi:SAM-dependent methyltransferase
MSTRRDFARQLAAEHLAAGDPTGWFQRLYAAADGNPAAVPWADLAPNPNLVRWLSGRAAPAAGSRALVVGCGLGDDAERLSERGYDVTAFDIAPRAVDWARERFPQSRVGYVCGDLLDPPAAWRDAFDLVFEAYTLQVLPPPLRARAIDRLASFLRTDGLAVIVARGREPHEPAGEVPWPLTRGELSRFVEAGLVEVGFEDFIDGTEDPPVRRFVGVYRRG